MSRRRVTDPLARVTEAQVMRATEAALRVAQARGLIGAYSKACVAELRPAAQASCFTSDLT